ncbi:MAG: ComEC/Rec2 family competence protein [Planctomycetota bacterium]
MSSETTFVRLTRTHAWAAVGLASLGVTLVTYVVPTLLSVVPFAEDLGRAGVWFTVAAALAGVAIAAPARLRVVAFVALALGVVAVFAGWTALRVVDTPSDRLDRSLSTEGSSPSMVRVEGIVRTLPRSVVRPHGRLDDVLFGADEAVDRTVFELRIDGLVGDDAVHRASGVLQVTVSGGMPEVSVGDRVRCLGWYSSPRAPRNPGQRDSRPTMAMEGRVGWLALSSPELVEVLGQRATPGTALAAIHGRLGAALGGDDTPGRALLRALVLGETGSASLGPTRDAFRDAGAAHLLAISGFHLTLLAGGVIVLLRLAGDRGHSDTLIVGAIVLVYALVLPTKAPIVRASALILALLVADLRGRRADRLTLLGWVTLGLIVWRPLDVFSLGAQLSVGVTALLIWLSERRPAWLVGQGQALNVEIPRESAWGAVWRVLRGSFMTALACWLVAAPAIAWHTGVFTPFAVLGVLVLTPAVILTLGMGFAACVIGLVLPQAGAAIGDGAVLVASFTAWIAQAVQSIPGGRIDLPSVSVWWVVAATVAMVNLCRCARWTRSAAWAPVALVLVWAVTEAHFAARLSKDVVLRIDMLDVGDGTCIIVRSAGETLAWDCGSLTPGLGARTIPKSLRALGVDEIETLVVTHANVDHYVFVPDVSATVGIGRVLVPDASLVALESSDAGARLLTMLSEDRVPVVPIERGATVPIGSASGVFLWPQPDARAFEENDRSAVLRLEVHTDDGPRSVLLTGDIQRAASIRLMQDPSTIDADILELPHHGGWHDAASAFVEAVTPTIVLQSTGRRRAESSASDERWGPVRTHLEGAGGAWWVTARDGAAWVEVLKDGSLRGGSATRPGRHLSPRSPNRAGYLAQASNPFVPYVHQDP